MSANHSVEVTIPSDLAEARRVQSLIEEALLASAYSEHDIFSIKLALEEALVNAIKHGNQMDPDKRVFVSYQVTPQRFDILITDEGQGFNPEDVPDPTAIENIERPCGRGLLLMRGFMTEVQYHGKGNSVSMAKVRDASA
jgi:serine/threonine-protein kinase RsbW